MNRPLEISAFLETHGWAAARVEPFAGDFSTRRYARLRRMDGTSAVLMDADADQKTAQFVALSALLRGLNTPRIYAADPARGLVLMQDFGDQNVGAMLDNGTAADDFWDAATGVLAKLHGGFTLDHRVGIDMPRYDTAHFTAQAELFLDFYMPFVTKEAISGPAREDFRAAWMTVLRPVAAMPHSLLLRDFMPDNMMLLPDGQLGLLDFQDAGWGPIAYDLASLCEVVRRDGGDRKLDGVLNAYRAKSNCAVALPDLKNACLILSAQRHMRILGIITRLASQGRGEKLSYRPRLEAYVRHLLAAPALMPVQCWLQDARIDFSPSQSV